MKKSVKKGLALLLAALLLTPGAALAARPDAGETPTVPALVIGGSQITRGRGFLKNVVYLSQAEVDGLREANSGSYAYKLSPRPSL